MEQLKSSRMGRQLPFFVVVAVLAVALVTSCTNPASVSAPAASGLSLTINLSLPSASGQTNTLGARSGGARTVTPTFATPSSYSVTFTNSTTGVFKTVTSNSTTVVATGLDAATYTIAVSGSNASSQIIVAGSSSINLATNPSPLTIPLSYIANQGTGALSVSFDLSSVATWGTAGTSVVGTPVFQVIAPDGSTQNPTLTVATSAPTYSWSPTSPNSGTYQFYFQATLSSGQMVTYSDSAMVYENLTTTAAYTASSSHLLTALVQPTGLSLALASSSSITPPFNIGQTFALTPTWTPASPTNTQLVWSSSAPSVVSVDQSGNCHVLAPASSAVITAQSVANPKVLAIYTVSVAPLTLSLSASTLTLTNSGTSTTVTVTEGGDATGTNPAVTLTSSNPSIATVTFASEANSISAFTVTPGSNSGTVTLTATSTVDPTVSVTCSVTVLTQVTFQPNLPAGLTISADNAVTQLVAIGSATSVNIPSPTEPASWTSGAWYFAGWGTSNTATTPTYGPGSSVTIPNTNLTLYAVWTLNPQWAWILPPPATNTVTVTSPDLVGLNEPLTMTATYSGSSSPTTSSWAWFLDNSTTPISGQTTSTLNWTVPATLPWGVHTMTAVATDAKTAYHYAGTATFRVNSGAFWKASSTPTGASAITPVVYGAGKFVTYVSSFSTAQSSDGGVTWTTGTTSPGFGSGPDIAYGNGVFACIYSGTATGGHGKFGTQVSSDGLTWGSTTLTNLSGSMSPAGWFLTYGNGMFVGIDTGGLYWATSPDGLTWTHGNLSATGSVTSLAYGNGLFEIAGRSTLYSSTDGQTWTAVTSFPGTMGTSYVTYLAGKWYAEDSSHNLYSSTDGQTYTPVTGANFGPLVGGNGILYSLGVNGSSPSLQYSLDGTTWWPTTALNSLYTTFNNSWGNWCFGNGNWVAVATATAGSQYAQ